MDYREAWEDLKSWLIDAQDEGFPYTITQVLEKIQEAEEDIREARDKAERKHRELDTYENFVAWRNANWDTEVTFADAQRRFPATPDEMIRRWWQRDLDELKEYD